MQAFILADENLHSETHQLECDSRVQISAQRLMDSNRPGW